MAAAMNLIVLGMHLLSTIFLIGLAGALVVLLTVGIGLLDDLDDLFGD